MGKNKKHSKSNVFKVAGAKSLKKSKSKAVTLGLKNLKKKVEDVDAQFLEINKNPKVNPNNSSKSQHQKQEKKQKNNPSKEDIEQTTKQIVNMDI